MYSLELRAIDHGDPRKYSDANITLTLDDYNEFAPVFEQATYKSGVDLSTLTPANTPLVTVSATDADRRDNKITYSITAGQRLEEFQINPNTGLISSGSFPINQVRTSLCNFSSLMRLLAQFASPSMFVLRFPI